MKRVQRVLALLLCIAMMLSFSSCDVLLGLIEGVEQPEPEDPCANGHTFSDEWCYDEEKHWCEATCEHSDLRSDEAKHEYVDGVCICGALEPVAPHEHAFAAVLSYDEQKHWYASTCGHEVVSGEALHELDESYACTACDYKHEHAYSDEWESDDAKHWRASTCGHAVRADESAHEYNTDFVCGTCGYGHEHTYRLDAWEMNSVSHWHASTCGHDVKRDEGAHVYLGGVCYCGAIETHEHSYDSAWSKDDTGHWHESTCGHNVVSGTAPHDYGSDFVCDTCGYQHEHTYSSEWSKDGTKHWHECECHVGLASAEEDHSFGEDYVCAVCGYEHEHIYSSEWTYDELGHWHAALCGHDVKGDFSEHFLGGDDACVGNCGYKYIAPHSHSYSTKWSKDANNHWHAAACEHTEEVSGFGAHVYGDDDVCDVCGCIQPIVLTSDDMRSGGWGYSDKKSYSSSKPRIGTRDLIFVKAGTVIKYDPNGFQIYIDLPTTLSSNSSTAATDGSTRAGWFSTPGEYVVQRDAYLGITISRLDGTTEIKPSQYDCDIVIFPGTGEVERTYEKVNVYRFGGEGNDWCFVYLPDGYDPDRAEPYPFVIANHGNGWNMDGSFKKANWTDNTMYMSAAEIATQKESKRNRFIATEDSSLWYSNPTIEALLAAGYIVCGAQNYGDNLYGNDNCTNAVVDFFNHMVATYNVESACHMIGASNGAMTTLNAAEKLGTKVKSMIIQYPLASIITHYLAGGHQDNIEAAYGLDTTKTYTKAELEAVLADYDVLYKNVVDGVKQGYYPALKVYYSMTDTLTTANANALPVIALLENSGMDVVGVQVDADGSNRQHGDSAHFDPEAYLEWFEAHK